MRKHEAAVKEAKRRFRREVWEEVKAKMMIDVKGKIKDAHRRHL